MATAERPKSQHARPSLVDPDGLPWLENGERMDQKTFHERYLRTPDGFKAELIGGVVYVMSSPVSIRHGRSDAGASGWLYNYCAATPGTEIQNNTTTILGEQSEPQPDSALFIRAECGGQTRDGEDEDSYTYGAPELIVETTFSSRSIDLGDKRRDYERAGVREYVVLNLRDRAVFWFELREGRFEALAPDSDGLYRSRVFPGLWLDPAALMRNDKPAVLAALNRGLASSEHAAFVRELERRRTSDAPPEA